MGNDIGDRVRLQEAVDSQRELVEAGLLPPHGVGDRLKFLEGGGKVVFSEVNCPKDHAEGGQLVQGCGGIIPSAGTSDNTGDRRVCRRHGAANVTVDGAFELNRSKLKKLLI